MDAPTVTPLSPTLDSLLNQFDAATAPAAAYDAPGSRNVRQTRRRMAQAQRKASGQRANAARTPDVETLYGPLVKAGLARIVRRRGKPPQIEMLIPA